jgi:ABC-2 type transport system ATP-binding protein
LEVEYLCNRVAIINQGRIACVGTPAELKGRSGAANLEEVFMNVVEGQGARVKGQGAFPVTAGGGG